MSRFPGIGTRIRARLRVLGYWKKGRPDVLRFCQEREHRPRYRYAWLRARLPTYENLVRLARDLDVSPEWVMFGAGPSTVAVTPRRATDPAAGARQPKIIDFTRLREVTSRLVRLETEPQGGFPAVPPPYFLVAGAG